MRVLGSVVALALLWATSAGATNDRVTVVLHAVETDFGPCDLADPCVAGNSNVEIAHQGQVHAIYMILRNYDSISAFHCAFDWDSGWHFQYGLWNCFPGFYSCEVTPNGPGQVLECGIDCVQGGSIIAGRLAMIPTSGCLSIIDSQFPTEVFDCQGTYEGTRVADANRGRVCVGPGGYDACNSVVPVESLTWGRIKGQYR